MDDHDMKEILDRLDRIEARLTAMDDRALGWLAQQAEHPLDGLGRGGEPAERHPAEHQPGYEGDGAGTALPGAGEGWPREEKPFGE